MLKKIEYIFLSILKMIDSRCFIFNLTLQNLIFLRKTTLIINFKRVLRCSRTIALRLLVKITNQMEQNFRFDVKVFSCYLTPTLEVCSPLEI